MDALHQSQNNGTGGSHGIPSASLNDSQQNINTQPYGYAGNSTAVADDFSTFFPDNSSAFPNTWESEALVDPRLQTNNHAFSPQPSTAWHQAPLQSSDLQAPIQGLQPQTYNHVLPPTQELYGYPTYPPQQYHPSYPTPGYDSRLTYPNDAMISHPSYGNHGPLEFERTDLQGQTISPSALQSFPYAHDIGSENHLPAVAASSQLSLRGVPASTVAPLQMYNEQKALSIVAAIPPGNLRGRFLIKDAAVLAAATNAEKVTGFVFVGTEPVDSDDQRVSIPKLPQRKSLSEVHREVMKAQGGRPWHPDQKPAMKKLKLSTPKVSRSLANGTAVPSHVAQTSPSESSSDSESESDQDSQYDSDSDKDEEPEETSPLPAVRPTDPKLAIEYDIVKAVWASRKAILTADGIRSSLLDYSNIFTKIRDSWKEEINAIQQAEEKKDKSKAGQHRQSAADQRSVMEKAIRLTIQHGHRSIVQRLGEIQKLFLTFYLIMADRIKENDYSGPLILNILELMSISSIDQALLEKTKLDKALPKLLKKGDEKVQALVKKVQENVASSTRPKSADGLAIVKPETGAKTESSGRLEPVMVGSAKPTAPPRAPDSATSLKRQREREGKPSSVPMAKKVAGALVSRSATTAPSKPLSSASKGATSTKTDNKSSNSAAANTNSTQKPKVNHVVSKPSSFFSSLQSASKKPGTTNAQKAAQQTDSKTTKQPDARIAATPPTVPPAKPVPSPPKPAAFSFTETLASLNKPQERKSSIHSPEEVKQETEEEKAKRLRKQERRKLRVTFKPDDSLREIRYFEHDPEEDRRNDVSMIPDVSDVGGEGRMLKAHKDREDEDDDGTASEESLAPWNIPTTIDFSRIEPKELAENSSTRGGSVEVKSFQRAVQEQRELTTLMAYYSQASDIPSTPREPTNLSPGEPGSEVAFGTPDDLTVTRQAQFYQHQMPPFHPPTSAVPSAPPINNISAVLQALKTQYPLQPAQPAPATQGLSPELMALFAKYSQEKPAPPPTQQPATPQVDVKAALLAFSIQNSLQNQTYTAPQVPFPDLRALLPQLTQQMNGQQSYQTSYPNENERKRQHENDGNEQYSDNKRSRGNKPFFGPPKVPCKYWYEGTCRKGDDCTFKHE